MQVARAVTLARVTLLFVASVASETQFTLKFDIDSQSLAEFYQAGQAVLLAFEPEVVGGWYIVSAVISPFSYNYVNWNSSGVSLFASSYQLREGAVLVVGSWTDAEADLFYPYQDGIFGHGRTVDWIGDNEIGTFNNGSTGFSFGLAQDIQTNSKWNFRVPLFASALLGFEHVAYDVTEPTVHLFIGYKALQVGMLTQDLFKVALSRISTVKFGASQEKHVVWDRNNGRFVPV